MMSRLKPRPTRTRRELAKAKAGGGLPFDPTLAGLRVNPVSRDSVVVFFRVHFSHPIFLFCAALVAGLVNSVEGGGTFVAFPAPLVTGMPAIAGNATNTAAVWPGTVASTVAYRNAFNAQARKLLPPLIGIGIIGGVIGAKVLVVTPQATFLRLIPWLMLLATLLFMAGPRITAWVKGRGAQQKSSLPLTIVGLFLALLISIYIGYFGAGVGILMLSLLALMGMDDIHAMNGVKVFLVSIVNGVAILTFIVARVIVWAQALLMIVAMLIGGYAGGFLAPEME